LGAGCVDDSERPVATAPAQAPTSIADAQAYLQHYGYLPSAELHAREPRARIIVDRPFERGVLDEPTREALKAFQGRANIPITGDFDEATRRRMAATRCGNVDAQLLDAGAPDSDGLVDKFALQAKLTRGSAIVRVQRWPAGGTLNAEIAFDIDQATLEFRRKTGFSMQRVASTVNPASGVWAIDLYFYSGNRPAGAPQTCPANWNTFPASTWAAVTMPTFFISSGEAQGPIPICVNTNTNFSWGSAPIGSTFDFYSILLHELGHATGLDHSSVGQATMQPFVDPGEFLQFTPDDLQAEWSRWGQWSPRANGPTVVQQVVWGPGDTLYALDAASLGNGNFRMWRRTNSNRATSPTVSGTWTQYDGFGVRLSYDGGRVWHVNSQGMAYWRNPEDTGWILINGCVRDIAGSESTGVWFAVGCDNNLYFAGRGEELQFLARPGNGASKISFDRRNVNLWTVDLVGNLYRGILGFEQRATGIKDVNVGDDGSVWVVTTGNKARLLNRQSRITSTAPDGGTIENAPAKDQFVPFLDNVSVRSIAGDGSGFPAMANTSNVLHDIRIFYTN
jgi:hypothetical protein